MRTIRFSLPDSILPHRIPSRFSFLALATIAAGCATTENVLPLDQIDTAELLEYLLPFFLLSALALGLVTFWFLRAFTGSLETDPRLGERNKREIEKMVKFCYVFPLLLLLAPVGPFGLILLTPKSGSHNGVYIALSQSPIGFVLGCVDSNDKTWDLSCGGDEDPYRYQWVLNIGGSAFFVDTFEKSTSSVVAQPTSGSPKPRHLDNRIRWLPAELHGGLVIPWYVLIVSIMGGAVGMLRRIPEYQRRALDPSDDSLSPARAREFLVFEIVQVASAPLIAITAYNLLTLQGRAAAVGVAFASGFSSEAILLAIRGFTDRLIGVEAKPAPGAKAEPPEEPLIYQEDAPGDRLRHFWKPDGKAVNSEQQKRLTNWLKDNGFGNVSITSFIRADRFSNARSKALTDLNIGE
jgi:hypothetical protein